MADSAPPSLEQLEHRMRNLGAWCHWIAGLTAVNAIAAYFGDMGFALGSVVAMAAMQIAAKASVVGQVVAIGFNGLVIAFFVTMGVFARKGHRWAFIVAFVAYLGDSLLLIAAPDVLAILLHLWALYSLGTGLVAAKTLRVARAEVAAQPPPLAPIPSAAPVIELPPSAS